MTLFERPSPYTLRGAGGKLLDAETDALREDRFQAFELEHLMQKGEQQLLPTLLYLFRRLEQRLNDQPTLLLLDETWRMLDHPVFRQKIVEWLKVLRKRNAAVVFSTQSLADLNRAGIADVVFESCPTKILLANAEAVTDNVRPLYERMGLNDRQIQILKIFGSSILISLFGTAAQLSQPQNSGAFNTPGMASQATANFATAMDTTAANVLNKNLNIAPTLNIRPGYDFNVLVNKTIVMDPWAKD
ncbi:MAG: hypothetical protein LBU72_02135 [Burkholderiaceae bacterium]|nr:hypothetical protein [Burkholderiaceae bacterium]